MYVFCTYAPPVELAVETGHHLSYRVSSESLDGFHGLLYAWSDHGSVGLAPLSQHILHLPTFGEIVSHPESHPCVGGGIQHLIDAL